jgi:hypothetical protein
VAAVLLAPGVARANPNVTVKINIGSEGPTQLDASVSYNGPGSSLQRFILGGFPSGATLSGITGVLPNGSTSPTLCAPVTSATAGNEIECDPPAGAVAPGQTFSLTFKISSPLTPGATFSYQAQDSTGTAVGTVPGPTSTPTVAPASECHCAHLDYALQDFRVEPDSVVFSLVWDMTCVTGTTRTCSADISIAEPPKIAGLHWRGPGLGLVLGTTRWEFRIHCPGKCTSETSSDSATFELIGSRHDRARKEIYLATSYSCNDIPTPLEGTEHLKLQFDSHGNLDRHHSQLG